eukprot:gene21117-biopygen7147
MRCVRGSVGGTSGYGKKCIGSVGATEMEDLTELASGVRLHPAYGRRGTWQFESTLDPSDYFDSMRRRSGGSSEILALLRWLALGVWTGGVEGLALEGLDATERWLALASTSMSEEPSEFLHVSAVSTFDDNRNPKPSK